MNMKKKKRSKKILETAELFLLWSLTVSLTGNILIMIMIERWWVLVFVVPVILPMILFIYFGVLLRKEKIIEGEN